jgi:hypothetical protein
MSMDSKPIRTTQFDWRLADAFYRALHLWPMLLVFCLAGAFLGWGASRIWPPIFRTRAQVFVSLNPYRVYSDSQFLALVYPQYTNVDDYKNWQMSQLSSVLLTDTILEETLNDLRLEDSYWNDISLASLRHMLRAEWRTAGTWTLLADSNIAKRSNQAVRAWSRNAVSGVKQAIFASEQLIQVDAALQKLINQKSDLDLLQQEYQITQQALQDWLDSAQALPQDQPLQAAERWEILYLAGRITQFSPSWLEVMAEQPDENALPPAYSEWINRLLVAIDAETPILAEQGQYLEEQRGLLAEQYDLLQEASLGLSPNLVIKSIEKSPPEVIRPTTLMVLIGTITGFLAWLYWLFVYITRQRLKH